jgi:hypothetical protein
MNSQKTQLIFERRAHAGVRQDKYPPERITAGAGQPLTANKDERNRPMITNPTRSQNDNPADNRPKHHGSEARQTQQIASRVALHLKSEIVRVAKRKGWSESKTVACLVEQALGHNLAEEFAVMLKNTLQDAITQQMHKERKENNRAGNLALEDFYSSEETRVFSIYLLRFLLGEDIELLPQIIKDFQEQARENVNRVLREGREEVKEINEQN